MEQDAVTVILIETLVGGYRCVMSWCDLDLTFDIDIVTLTYKFCSGYISETRRCRS